MRCGDDPVEVFLSCNRTTDLEALGRDVAILVSLLRQHGCSFQTMRDARDARRGRRLRELGGVGCSTKSRHSRAKRPWRWPEGTREGPRQLLAAGLLARCSKRHTRVAGLTARTVRVHNLLHMHWRATMPTATKLRNLDGWTGEAQLYRLSEPLDGHDHVIVSATYSMFSEPETYIFGADADGENVDFSDSPAAFAVLSTTQKLCAVPVTRWRDGRRPPPPPLRRPGARFARHSTRRAAPIPRTPLRPSSYGRIGKRRGLLANLVSGGPLPSKVQGCRSP